MSLLYIQNNNKEYHAKHYWKKRMPLFSDRIHLGAMLFTIQINRTTYDSEADTKSSWR